MLATPFLSGTPWVLWMSAGYTPLASSRLGKRLQSTSVRIGSDGLQNRRVLRLLFPTGPGSSHILWTHRHTPLYVLQHFSLNKAQRDVRPFPDQDPINFYHSS